MIILHVESNVRCVQEIVGEIFLDDIAFVAAANEKIINAMGGIIFHDVLQDRLAADFNHGLWANRCFFTDACAQTTGKDDCFHFYCSSFCESICIFYG